ncbi:MAG: hypothetical protein ACE5HM_01545 [Acidiferrobacterales bacterium]
MKEPLGRFVFSTEYRDVGNDKGLTIRVLGPTSSSQQQAALPRRFLHATSADRGI